MMPSTVPNSPIIGASTPISGKVNRAVLERRCLAAALSLGDVFDDLVGGAGIFRREIERALDDACDGLRCAGLEIASSPR
jgi:hypothetical protein